MEQTMRQMLLVLFAFAVFGDGISPATAQTWPERPVTMVVPFPGRRHRSSRTDRRQGA